MQKNYPVHSVKLTIAYIAKTGSKDIKLIEWFPASLGFNLMENLWTIIKRDWYENGKQY